jgi:hypothetical protein
MSFNSRQEINITNTRYDAFSQLLRTNSIISHIHVISTLLQNNQIWVLHKKYNKYGYVGINIRDWMSAKWTHLKITAIFFISVNPQCTALSWLIHIPITIFKDHLSCYSFITFN